MVVHRINRQNQLLASVQLSRGATKRQVQSTGSTDDKEFLYAG